MNKKIGKTLFGLKPGEVEKEFQRIDAEYQEKVISLKVEIEKAKAELEKAEKKLDELKEELNKKIKREQEIAEVMINAQVNAQRIEDDARQKAQTMLERTEAELKEEERELDILRVKVARFKEEFREVLDKYKLSLEMIKESPEDTTFTPSIVGKGHDNKIKNG